jgi:hypothetical protein
VQAVAANPTGPFSGPHLPVAHESAESDVVSMLLQLPHAPTSSAPAASTISAAPTTKPLQSRVASPSSSAASSVTLKEEAPPNKNPPARSTKRAAAVVADPVSGTDEGEDRQQHGVSAHAKRRHNATERRRVQKLQLAYKELEAAVHSNPGLFKAAVGSGVQDDGGAVDEAGIAGRKRAREDRDSGNRTSSKSHIEVLMEATECVRGMYDIFGGLMAQTRHLEAENRMLRQTTGEAGCCQEERMSPGASTGDMLWGHQDMVLAGAGSTLSCARRRGGTGDGAGQDMR